MDNKAYKINNKAKHFWKELGDDTLENWELVHADYSFNDYCLCGTKIKYRFIIKHTQTETKKTVGRYCAKRLGIKMSWRSKADYILSASYLAKSKWEKDFVKTIQDKLPAWGSRLTISQKQANILHKITGHKWFPKSIWVDDHVDRETVKKIEEMQPQNHKCVYNKGVCWVCGNNGVNQDD